MSSYRILPLPLYVHYAEMQGNVHLTEVYEDGEKLHMEKLTPMRIFGTIVEIHEDDTISFQWAKDKRNLHEYQNILNEYYELQPIEKNIQ
uniref:Uncharacterized protein n=1 Tax=Panagrolaimus sp. ES5 TaxID=591445 RepID=A0AC34GGG2_9BILA